MTGIPFSLRDVSSKILKLVTSARLKTVNAIPFWQMHGSDTAALSGLLKRPRDVAVQGNFKKRFYLVKLVVLTQHIVSCRFGKE